MPELAPHKRNSLVLGAAVGLIAIPFGVLASTAGLSLAKAMFMSLFVFTGASQFAAVGVISSGGSPLSAVASALLLAARNSLYGMRLSELMRPVGWKRIPGAQLVIDESTALALAQEDDERSLEALWWTGATVFVFWNIGTVLGVQLGDVVGDPETYGLDAAFPASFVALLGPLVREMPARVAALAGSVIAMVAVPFTPAGLPILLAALGVVPALLFTRPAGAS